MSGETQNKHKPVLQQKPAEVRFKLPLNPDITSALKNTFQEKIYLQQLESKGNVEFFHLQKTNNEQYYLVDQTGRIVPQADMASVYAYVILEQGDHLELRLGNCNHYFLADRNDSVVAAGDIYFQANSPAIEKFTNQSGGYHFPTSDPRAFSGLNSSMAAMEACGLPMHKFNPVVPAQTLLFSNALKPMFLRKANPGQTGPQINSQINSTTVSLAEEKMRDILAP